MNMEVIEKDSVVETPVAAVAVAPVADAPVADAPVADTPVADTPVAEAPNEASAVPEGETNRPLLVDIPVDSESTALNLLVGFLNVAQRRGTFNFRESAKIGECIEMFVKAGQ